MRNRLEYLSFWKWKAAVSYSEPAPPKSKKGTRNYVRRPLPAESLRVHSPRLAAFVVIPAEAGIQRNGLDSVSSTE
jgi:hypothetical protein